MHVYFREQHSMWSATNSLHPNFIKTDSAECPGEENLEASKPEGAESQQNRNSDDYNDGKVHQLNI